MQQHPLPLPDLGRKGTSLLYGLTKKLQPRCSWSRVGGNINIFFCCWVLAADGLLSSRVRLQYTI